MDYNLTRLCVDQLETLEKRLRSFKKKALNEYDTALAIINNFNANQKCAEIEQELDDLLNKAIDQTGAIYTDCLNKIQRVIGTHIQ